MDNGGTKWIYFPTTTEAAKRDVGTRGRVCELKNQVNVSPKG